MVFRLESSSFKLSSLFSRGVEEAEFEAIFWRLMLFLLLLLLLMLLLLMVFKTVLDKEEISALISWIWSIDRVILND